MYVTRLTSGCCVWKGEQGVTVLSSAPEVPSNTHPSVLDSFGNRSKQTWSLLDSHLLQEDVSGVEVSFLGASGKGGRHQGTNKNRVSEHLYDCGELLQVSLYLR